jgi:hypothetical protein
VGREASKILGWRYMEVIVYIYLKNTKMIMRVIHDVTRVTYENNLLTLYSDDTVIIDKLDMTEMEYLIRHNIVLYCWRALEFGDTMVLDDRY